MSPEPPRIYRLNFAVSNGWLILSPNGAIVVDAGLPGQHGQILRTLRALSVTRLDLIFITHAHIDHYGSAAALRRATGAPIAVHAADADALAQGASRLGALRAWHWTRTPMPAIERVLRVEPTPPDLLLLDGDPVRQADIEGCVVHTPGHTQGSVTLLLSEGAAFVGDLLLASGAPHAQRTFAQQWPLIAPSIERLRAARPTLLYSGHGRSPISADALAALQITGPAARQTHTR